MQIEITPEIDREDFKYLLEEIDLNDKDIRVEMARLGYIQSPEDSKFLEIKDSPIEGIGTFASKKFNKNEYIGTSLVMPTRNKYRRYLLARSVNHSISPNTMSLKTSKGIDIYATRDIEIGDEITIDYRHNRYVLGHPTPPIPKIISGFMLRCKLIGWLLPIDLVYGKFRYLPSVDILREYYESARREV